MIHGAEVLRRARDQRHGFLSPDDVCILARDPDTRLSPVLARMSTCRFTAPADQVREIVQALERDGGRMCYLRDYSIPVTSEYYASRPAAGQMTPTATPTP